MTPPPEAHPTEGGDYMDYFLPVSGHTTLQDRRAAAGATGWCWCVLQSASLACLASSLAAAAGGAPRALPHRQYAGPGHSSCSSSSSNCSWCVFHKQKKLACFYVAAVAPLFRPPGTTAPSPTASTSCSTAGWSSRCWMSLR